MSAAARLGAFCAAAIARIGGTQLEVAMAEVIGGALAQEGSFQHGVYVSTRALQERCFDRGAFPSWYHHRPSYGSVARVLALLEQVGIIRWTKAHVRRWHGDADYPLPRPVRHAEGLWRLPVRRIFVVGFAATFLCPAARTATSIVTPESEKPRVSRSSEIAAPESREESQTPFTIEVASECAEREWLPESLRKKLRL